MAAVKPKHLILNLLAEAEAPIGSQQFIRIGQLFGITDNSIRVSLARLVSDNMLKTPSRGFYLLGSSASKLAEDLAQWRSLESKVCNWDGAWIGAFISVLGRADRTGLRRRTRVLQLAGFEQLETGLLVRPNNLMGGTSQLRERLYRLGLEPEAMIFSMAELGPEAQAKAMALWDTAGLHEHYVQGIKEMESWMASAHQLSPEAAARECFLIGDQVLRCIAYDPMLPEEMIDTQARRRYVETMVRYDQLGKEIWQQVYLNFSEHGASNSAASQ